MDWKKHITADPEVLTGKPVFRGTRLAVGFILALLAEGWTEAQIIENYPALTGESIRAAYAFAAEVVGDPSLIPSRRGVG